ncbi:enoyl-CoA hydratase [Paraburkholderia antibiotica]|uniref:Enoyl-CoA hydratase n=1 Tax=Paraburkholderia antibiotica TaxID=2728839 RepID=A0A7X9X5D6_9BURK|nr:enoyl-CoA hydratase [Paraburkholderia antibiotica]NML31751.1 enoyl-CoA hydratase [Paraburkholderia antibiotica]
MTEATHHADAAERAFTLSIDDRGVATLALHIGKINVLHSKVAADLVSCLAGLSQDSRVRCLILRGNERAFIGGADINEMVALDSAAACEFIAGLYHVCEAVHNAPFPVIARIHGWCFGVGAELAAACDIRVASQESWYAMPEVKIGIPSVIQASLLPTLIGAGRARYWLITGRRIDARTAFEWGLVNEVVSVDELDDAVNAVVQDICECPPNAIRLQKQLCNSWESAFPDDAARASIDTFGDAYETSEPAVAMRHFLDSRKRR